MASDGARGKRRRGPRLNFEQRILLRAILIWLPTFAVLILVLWMNDYSSQARWTAVILLGLFALGMAFALKDLVLRPLQTVSNMLASIREEDFSFKARGGGFDDALGELVQEVNALSEMMRQRRMGALEAISLLKQVMMEIDVAVLTFDQKHRLRMINRAGEQLLAMPSERALERTAEELGVGDYLNIKQRRTEQVNFPGKQGRWLIQARSFRESGVPHTLLLISDLSSALRDEERQAWQRLTRVLGHELNNSLAPIKSIASTLKMLVNRDQPPPDWQQDVRRGLDVIESRADALARFMQGYTRLARLPAPILKEVNVGEMVAHVADAEARLPVHVHAGPVVTVLADPDQIEQVLINLVKNAVEASLASKGRVEIGWKLSNEDVLVYVTDEGEGLLNTSNLFVPFFTTKPGGSGIGLALSRQIAEAHGGSLNLENRRDRLGCIATLRLHARSVALDSAAS
jgi:nitrogen fixation/metabolism regulation signal transduction histidine kinase